MLKKLLKDRIEQWNWEAQAPKDWHLSWQDHFKPLLIENKLAVIPPWENDFPGKINIKIKPGMAFGTGHHETTHLILKTLLKENIVGETVLDFGTGSGILSIAAAKLGALNISAVEFDSDCRINFFENLDLNGLNGQIDYYSMDVLKWKNFDYQYILFNMNRNIILKRLPGIQIPKDGKMFLTGILDKDEKVVTEKCNSNNLKVIEKQYKGQWACLTVISP